MAQVLSLAAVAPGDAPVPCSGLYRCGLSCEKEQKHLLEVPALRMLLSV